MTKDDVIRMAREADCGHEAIDLQWIAPDNLERFAALVVAHEREECAKVCDAEADGRGDEDAFMAKLCAKAIRARGNA